ncbi:unnamed protein product [Lathyrus sativus]|nr:unnamed protein product [Lathyrus sativus]
MRLHKVDKVDAHNYPEQLMAL